ncbi:hypothetical protein EJO70_00175 [Variovorax sp. 553]|nr:hypothetical protein EJO70_00175 [Variovorax sp. 553]RSZ48795.1 hypothetical protein EJO71_03795 [Variovorax sp. 679]
MSLLLPPRRGRRRRPGKAGSAASCEWGTPDSRTGGHARHGGELIWKTRNRPGPGFASSPPATWCAAPCCSSASSRPSPTAT